MSDGHCEVDLGYLSDDADPCEFWNKRMVTARKKHKCSECGNTIAVGERHQVVAYKFEGTFGSDRWCDPCCEAAAEFDYHIFGGNLWMHFDNEWDQGAHITACINRLTTARAKEHMRQQWLKWMEKRRE